MSRPLTEKDEAEYLEHKGVRCPFCGSTDISSGTEHREADWYTTRVGCESCGALWYDVLTLTGVLQEDGSPPTEG